MNRLLLVILLFVFWILLTWPVGPPGRAYLQDVVVGLVVAILAGSFMGKSAGENISPWFQPKRYALAAVYFFVLAAYVVKANVEVAYRVLHPGMPIRPGIVRVRTKLRGPAARAMLGNSITLCPGTLTIDICDDGVMIVHWIYVRTLDEKEAALQIIGRFEWYLARIFE